GRRGGGTRRLRLLQRAAHRRADPGRLPRHLHPAVLLGGLRDDPRGCERLLPRVRGRRRDPPPRASRRLLPSAGRPAGRDPGIRRLADQDRPASAGYVRRLGARTARRPDARPGAPARRDPRRGARSAVSTIARFDARLLRVPLTRPWGADVTSVGVIETHVMRADGAEGWGF